jgi:hypothetical protein
MALNFPSAPVLGQVYQAEGVTFVWNGTLWVVLSPASATFATKAEAEAGVRDDRLLSPVRAKEAIAALSAPSPGFDPGVALCRAWCRYNGETHTIISSFNIASLLNEGGGVNRLFFQTPMEHTGYITLGNARGVVNHPALCVGLSATVMQTVNDFRINTGTTGGSGHTGFNRASPLVHVSVWL